MVVGLVAVIPILETIGVILLVVGAILWVLGSMGRAVGFVVSELGDDAGVVGAASLGRSATMAR